MFACIDLGMALGRAFDTRINWSKAKAYALTENQLIKNIRRLCNLKHNLKPMRAQEIPPFYPQVRLAVF